MPTIVAPRSDNRLASASTRCRRVSIGTARPPGTALLIAVLEGEDAVRDHYREAVLLAAGVLRRARAGQAPEAAAFGYDGPPA